MRKALILILLSFIGSAVFAQPLIPKEVIRSYSYSELSGFNTEYMDFCPILIGNEMIYTSDEEVDFVKYGEHRWNKHPQLNIMSREVTQFANDSLAFGKPDLFSEKIKSQSHSGPISFSKDGKLAVFTQVHYKKVKGFKLLKYRPQLYYTYKVKGKWTKPELFPFDEPEHSYGHPFVTDNGNTVYFASDLPGGYGGKDIYYVKKEGDSWSKPINLGKKVNSTSNEVFPSISNGYLFFASDKAEGQGGLDVYTYNLEEDVQAVNLGPEFNSDKDDFGLSFLGDGMTGFFTSNRDGGEGSDDIYRFKISEEIIVEKDFLSGNFAYRHLKDTPSNLKIQLLDDEGNIVDETFTDEDGNFVFRNLIADKNYMVKAINEDGELELTVYNDLGKKVGMLLSNSDGEFVYRRLNNESVGTLGLIDLDDDTEQGELNGQFIYQHLANEYPNNLKVMLVDEEGNVQFTTTTDEYGNFQFRNLDMTKNYLVKLEDSDQDLTMFVYDKMDDVKAILRMDNSGTFTYRELHNDHQNNLSSLELEDDEVFADVTATIYGQFVDTKGKNITKELDVTVYDQNKGLIESAKTNGKGYFRLSRLPLTESYLIKLNEEDSEFGDKVNMFVMNRKGEKVALLKKDQNGFFVYTPLGLGGALDLSALDLEDGKMDDFIEVPTVYYDKNSSKLRAEGKAVLKDLAAKLKADSNMKVEANSYADSRASAEFNLKLSQKRTESVLKYLKRLGVQDAQLSGNAYGESKLLNDCGDGIQCPEELHQLNRRSEIRVYK